jgi:hypothetical protein
MKDYTNNPTHYSLEINYSLEILVAPQLIQDYAMPPY